MNGFLWVRIDRTLDGSGALKLMARSLGKDALYALGLVVRTKLNYATSWPTGLAPVDLEHMAAQLDATEEDVQALVRYGFLMQEPDGLRFAGWSDDPAVRDLMARRGRQATGSQPAGERMTDGSQTDDNRQASVQQTAGGGQAAHSTGHDMTGHDKTGHADMPQSRDGESALPIIHAQAAGIVLAAWPAEKRCSPRALLAAIRQDQANPDLLTCRKIAISAKAWLDAYTAQGRAQYLPRLDNWISSGAWREQPPADAPAPAGPARRARTKSGEPAVTLAELDAIIDQAKAAGL